MREFTIAVAGSRKAAYWKNKKVTWEAICEKMHFASLEFQTLDGVIKAIGLDPCDLCTYCWNGKE